MKTSTYIDKANKKHNTKYDYKTTDYKTSKDLIEIGCPIHGIFKQVASAHLMGNGCPKCGKKKFNTETFIIESNRLYNDLYSYNFTIYKTLKNKVIVTCPIHGNWSVTPSVHLLGKGCPKCNQMNTPKFIDKANTTHKNKYNYDLSVYTKANNKLIIKCPIHGSFNQRASAHLEGQGCPKCGNSFNIHLRNDWLKLYEHKETTFYILKCFNEDELFYKIGITGNFKKRYDSKSKMPYHYEIVKMIHSFDNGYIFDLEKKILHIYNNQKYMPLIKFSGKGECFTIYPTL